MFSCSTKVFFLDLKCLYSEREAEHHGTERPNDGLMQGVNVRAASTSRGWLNELRTGSREVEKGFYKPMCVCVYVLRLGTKFGLNSTAPFT